MRLPCLPHLVATLALCTLGSAQQGSFVDRGPRGFNSVIAHDSVRGRTVRLVPVSTIGNYDTFETWEWDGTSWLQRFPITSPSAATTGLGPITFDAFRKRTVGLFAVQGLSPQTWEWDGTTWTKMAPLASPTPREFPVMAYDSLRRRVVMYGGRDFTSASLDDTWEYDGTTWVMRQTAARPTPVRGDTAMCYDSVRSRVVLFGGNGPPATWEYDGSNWSNPSAAPPFNKTYFGATLSYDPVLQSSVLLIGASTVTHMFLWNGTAWSQLGSCLGISPGTYPQMVYDTARARHVILVSGFNTVGWPLPDTWEWNGPACSFAQRTPSSGIPPVVPSPLIGRAIIGAIAFDTTRYVSVLLSRNSSGVIETWEWDGMYWQRKSTAFPLAATAFQGMAYDASRQRCVVVTGGGLANPRGACEWDGATWTQVATPPANASVNGSEPVTYDPVRKVVLWYNGDYMYQWNGVAWQAPSQTLRPSQRYSVAMTFDSIRGATVVHGGRDAMSGLPLTETWQWDGQQWMKWSLGLNPSSTDGILLHSADRQALVLFAGGQHWELLGSQWVQRSSSNVTARPSRVATMDTLRGCIVFVSAPPNSTGNTVETWEYVVPTATMPASLGLEASSYVGPAPLGGDLTFSFTKPPGAGALVLGPGLCTTGGTPLLLAGFCLGTGPANVLVHPNLTGMITVPTSAMNTLVRVPAVPAFRDVAFCLQGVATDATSPCLRTTLGYRVRVQGSYFFP